MYGELWAQERLIDFIDWLLRAGLLSLLVALIIVGVFTNRKGKP